MCSIINTIAVIASKAESTLPPNVKVFEPNALRPTSLNTIAGGIMLFVPLFSMIVYFLLLIFYKGTEVKITITDKWIKRTGEFIQEPGELETCIVTYKRWNQKRNRKSKKEYLVYCPWYIYHDLKIGETCLVFQKFKKIKEIREGAEK